MSAITESVVEDSALAWLEGCGWDIAHGPATAPEAGAGFPAVMNCPETRARS